MLAGTSARVPSWDLSGWATWPASDHGSWVPRASALKAGGKCLALDHEPWQPPLLCASWAHTAARFRPGSRGEGTHPRTEHTQWEERQGHTVRAYRMGEIVVTAFGKHTFLAGDRLHS